MGIMLVMDFVVEPNPPESPPPISKGVRRPAVTGLDIGFNNQRRCYKMLRVGLVACRRARPSVIA